MSFHDTLHRVSTGFILKMAIPRWAMGLTGKWAETRTTSDELEVNWIVLFGISDLSKGVESHTCWK